MTREQKLESMLMTLFTLAPNVKQKDWDEIYEQYKNLSTSHNSDYTKCKKCGREMKLECSRCNFPTFDNTVKPHFA